MTTKKIAKYLLKVLKPFGAIEWHESRHSSQYIKFRDVRLGSIRIADHTGRQKYSYTYELTDESTQTEIDQVVNKIILKSKSLLDFHPQKYIVYSEKYRTYVEAKDFKTYKNHILKKELL